TTSASSRPPNNNGTPPVVRPNGPAPRSMEELCQPSIHGRDGPIASIPIQAMDFGLRHHMIQQRQSPSGSGLLPSNTIANLRGDLKAITTQSGVAYDGPTIPPTPSLLLKEVEREIETTKDKVQITCSKSIAHAQPLVLQVPISEPNVVLKPNLNLSIPYPSRLNDQNLREKTNNQMLKFLQIFQRLHFDLSFADALLHIPKEPGRFLIPYDFQWIESCMALADLGASINLIPLYVWKKLSLLDLTSTRMTLELATRSIAYPAGIAEDVFVQVGAFTFLANFVVIDYDVDPHVPLILGRPFLRTARTLVDVHGEELILRDDDEKLIFHADSTLKHPHKRGNESINMINFIDITCEDHFLEVLNFKKSNHPSSGSTTPLPDSSPSLMPFETSDSLLEEFANELALPDPFPPGNEVNNFDFEADLREIEFLLNQDPPTESNIETIDPILKKFTDEHALDYLPPLGDDDDDLFDLKSDNDKWKKLLYGDCYKDIDSEKDKNKDSKMKSLVIEAHIVESNDLLL
nr:reverse transcriptase domain-containing protein [Tanacetum cinerariifolium]